MSTYSRREFLTTAAATAAAVAVPGLAGAAEPPEWSPDHITNVGDDLDQLQQYEPHLDIRWSDQEQLQGIYGWYADSSKYDTRAYYFWCKYIKQDSWADQIPLLGPLLSRDSHFKDHEPIAIFVDRDSGEVQEVLYSGFHHYAVNLPRSDITLIQQSRDFPTHVSLKVATPHHHLMAQPNTTTTVPAHTIRTADFGSFLDEQPEWERNNVFASSHRPAVFDPWQAKKRGYWWANGTWDKRFAELRLLLTWRDEAHDELVTE